MRTTRPTARLRPWPAVAGIALLALSGTGPARAASDPKAVSAPAPEEFFIVSSIDAPHSRIVLKEPTEVTRVMRVTAHTIYRDERGRPLRFSDVRSGDTVYIRFEMDSNGISTARSVRRGPMTVRELERRYLKPNASSDVGPR
jgi:hypothetical protein